ACSHAQPPPAPPPAKIVAAEPPPPPPPAPPVAPPPPAEIAPSSVYFDYDASTLSSETRSALQSFFDQAHKRSDQDIRIEGNCDGRGRREYNVALGQRRAEAAKKYLQDLGLDGSRVTTISNGKERPRVTGHDEEAWKQNRRDDLIPTAGKVAASGIDDQASRCLEGGRVFSMM